MSNSIHQQNAIYAILADSVYWDVRYGGKFGEALKNSNWTPVPTGWSLINEHSGSGTGILNPDGFTARAYKNGNFS